MVLRESISSRPIVTVLLDPIDVPGEAVSRAPLAGKQGNYAVKGVRAEKFQPDTNA